MMEEQFPPLVQEQLEFNRKEREAKIPLLPEELREMSLSFLKDHQILKQLIQEFRKSPKDHDREPIVRQIVGLEKYARYGFNPFFIQKVIESLEMPTLEFDLLMEMSVQYFIMLVFYMQEVKDYIAQQLKTIVLRFGSKEALGLTDYRVRLLDAVPFNRGKVPTYIVFIKGETTVFKVVYKPRNAQIDQAIMETFEEINRLPPEDRSSQIPLPVYKIMTDKDRSLWEFVEGEHIPDPDRKHMRAIGDFLSTRLSGARLLRAQESLIRLLTVLLRMGVGDYHVDNILIRNLNDETKDVEFVPIDLDLRYLSVRVEPQSFTVLILTPAEERVIDESYLKKARQFPSRMTFSCEFLEKPGNYSRVSEVMAALLDEWAKMKLTVVMTKEELYKHILASILDCEIPHILRFQDKLYYDEIKPERLIGTFQES